jgi:hypothetical protein
MQLEESVGVMPAPNVPIPPIKKTQWFKISIRSIPFLKRPTTTKVPGSLLRATFATTGRNFFEDSIKTPSPDEWSPAMPYLYEAYKLEKEGANNQQRIQKLLEEAKRIDANATNTYLIRQAIIKKREK